MAVRAAAAATVRPRHGHGGGAGGDWLRGAQAQGRAVQIDPIKPTLKVPGTKLLKLEYDEPLSNLAFKINVRRYMKDRMQRTGDAMIGFQPIDSMNLPNFFRLVLPNPRHLSREDLRDMMARMVGCRTWCHHADRIGATDHMRKVHRWYYSFSLRCTLGMIRLR